jgi:hypothetical protein
MNSFQPPPRSPSEPPPVPPLEAEPPAPPVAAIEPPELPPLPPEPSRVEPLKPQPLLLPWPAIAGVCTALAVGLIYFAAVLPAARGQRAEELAQAQAAEAEAAAQKKAAFDQLEAAQTELHQLQDGIRNLQTESPKSREPAKTHLGESELSKFLSASDWQQRVTSLPTESLPQLTEAMLQRSWEASTSPQRMRALQVAQAAAQRLDSPKLQELVSLWTHALAGFRAPTVKEHSSTDAALLTALLSLQRVNLSASPVPDQLTVLHQTANATDDVLVKAAAYLQLARAAAQVSDPRSQAAALRRALTQLQARSSAPRAEVIQ